jgi:hypothetical protein
VAAVSGQDLFGSGDGRALAGQDRAAQGVGVAAGLDSEASGLASAMASAMVMVAY